MIIQPMPAIYEGKLSPHVVLLLCVLNLLILLIYQTAKTQKNAHLPSITS